MNAIQCLKCGDVIESKSVHDFRYCSCGAVAVDGGEDYKRRVGNPEDYREVTKPIDVASSPDASGIGGGE